MGGPYNQSVRSVLFRLRSQVFLELGAITCLGLLYIAIFMPLTPDKSMSGVEHERLTGVVLAAEVGLKSYGHIPTWNPYIGIGEPLLNNPFNYLFNPFTSVPILLFGGIQGSKLAIVLGLLIAGYNAWAFMRVIGSGTVARVAVGGLYLMSGGIAGKFNPGHFQLGLSLAWVPLVFAGLWWTLRSRDRRAPVLTAVAFAFLFFTGNIYYTLHTLVCCLVIVVFHLFQPRIDWHLRVIRLKRTLAAGILAVGLAALQFWPVWSIRDSITHGGDPGLENRYSLVSALDNYITSWEQWQLTMPESRLVSVDYAYLGWLALMPIGIIIPLLLLSRRARQRFNTGAAGIAIAAGLIMMTWGAGQTGLLQHAYANVPILAEFRFVGRAHSVAAFWWLVLTGLGIDLLWQVSRSSTQNATFRVMDRNRMIAAIGGGILAWAVLVTGDVLSRRGHITTVDAYRLSMTFGQERQPAIWLFIVMALTLDTGWLIWLAIWRGQAVRIHALSLSFIGSRLFRIGVLALVFAGLNDVMQVNSTVFSTGPRLADFNPIYAYVRQHDSAPFPAIYEPNTGKYAFEAYYQGTRTWGLDEGWTPAALPGPNTTPDLPDDASWILVIDADSTAAQGREFILQQCINEWTRQNAQEPCSRLAELPAALYRYPEALPYSFIVPTHLIADAPETIRPDTVTATTRPDHDQDTITVIARTPDERAYMLVIQETHFPGWRAFIDGIPVESTSAGRFISIAMLPGLHTYTLRYEPPGFAAGVSVFLLTIVGIRFYLRNNRPGTDHARAASRSSAFSSSGS